MTTAVSETGRSRAGRVRGSRPVVRFMSVVPSVPRPLLWLSALVLVVGVVILIAGALSVGVSADEPFHLQRFANWEHGGWYIADFQAKDGAPAPGVTDQYVYGPATMVLLHGLCRLVGVDAPGHVSASPHAYLVRHVGVAVISLVAVLGVALIVRLALRSWGWALVAAAALVSVPLWTGHSMFNPKDPAVGAGYTVVTLALVWIARDHAGRGWRRLAGPLLLGAGAWLAMGTRPGMWSAVAAGVVATVVLCALRPRDAGRSWGWWRLGEIAVGLVLGYAGLVALYPNVFAHPVAMMTRSASSSADFLIDESTASPFTIPFHVLFIMPLGFLAFVAIGTIGVVRSALRARLRLDTSLIRISLAVVQMLALPVVAMVHATNVASDVRQLLFAVPGAAVVATAGLASCVRSAQRSRPSGRAFVTALGMLALAVPTFAQAELFPYSYAAYNVLPDLAGTTATMPKDHYEISARALASHVTAASPLICNPTTHDGPAKGNGTSTTFVPFDGLTGTDDCRWGATSVIGPWSPAVEGSPRTSTRFQAITFWDTPSANCRPVDSVTRLLLWRRITLSTLWDCDRAYQVLGTKPVLQISNYLDSGWYGNVGSQGGPAALSFLVPASLGSTATLRIELFAPPVSAPSAALVDGRQVPVTVTGQTVEVPLPTVPDDRLVHVSLLPPAGAQLSIQLLTLQLESR